MKPSPCLSPVRVQKADGSFVFVPCGHCDACVAGKGFNRSNRLKDVLTQYRYQFFVTLTYADTFLPFADFSVNGDNGDVVLTHSIDKDYKGIYHHVTGVQNYSDKEGVRLLDYCNEHYNGRIPVLCHKHLIDFKKRFRYYLKKYSDENEYKKTDLFIYAVGEYGPTNFRPHFHLLLCTNCEPSANLFEKCVRASWSRRVKVAERVIHAVELGRIDFQRVLNGTCHSYVAQYLNCSSCLPALLQRTCFRQFKTSSLLTSFEFSRLKDFDFISFVACPSATLLYESPVDNTVVDIPVPDFLQNRIFPKFTGFSRVDYWTRISLYRVYQRFPLSCVTFCDYFWYKFQLGFDDYPETFVRAMYLLYYVGATKESFYHNMTKLWYVSRIVCVNCQNLGLDMVLYVDQILLYYSKKALYKLEQFYNLQKDLLDAGCSVSSLLSLYYDTDDNLSNVVHYSKLFGVVSSDLDFKDFSMQRKYESLMHKIILDTTKTKKRNNYFEHHGLRRKPYLPIFKKRLLNF